MSLFDDIRKVAPWTKNLSDEEIIAKGVELTGASTKEVAANLGYSAPTSDFGKEMSAGWAGYKAGLEHIGGALGSTTAKEWALQNETKAQVLRELSNAPHEWDEVKFGDPNKGVVNYLGQLAAGSAPYAAEQALFTVGDIATGGALTPAHALRLGELTSAGVRKFTGKAAAEAAAGTAAKDVLAENVARTVGGTYASYPSSLGQLLQNQNEEAGQYNLPAAAAMALPYSALNQVGIEGAITRRSLNPLNILNRPGRALGTGLMTGVSESGGEIGQAFLENVARKTVNPDYDLTGEQALHNLKESAIGGFALGGAFGTVGGAFSKKPGSMLPGSNNPDNLGHSAEGNAIDTAINANSPELQLIPSINPYDVGGHVTAFNQGAETTIDSPQQGLFGGGGAAVLPPTAAHAADVAATRATQASVNQQQQAQQQQQTLANLGQQFGATSATAGTVDIGGKRLYGTEQVKQFLTELNTILQGRSETDMALASAAVKSGLAVIKQTGKPQQLINKIGSVLDSYQVGHVDSVEEAAQILNDQISLLEGPSALKEADKINSLYAALTGQAAPAYEKVQASLAETPAKGAKPKQEAKPTTPTAQAAGEVTSVPVEQYLAEKGISNEGQLQNAPGVGKVPVQGGATETGGAGAGNIRPTQVQPVGAGSVGEGPLGLQVGAVSGARVPTSTSRSTGVSVSGTERTGQRQGEITEQETARAKVEALIKDTFGTRHAAIIYDVLVNDLSQREVGEKYGMKQQSVSEIAGKTAQASWGPRILLAAKRQGMTQADVYDLLVQASPEAAAEVEQELIDDAMRDEEGIPTGETRATAETTTKYGSDEYDESSAAFDKRELEDGETTTRSMGVIGSVGGSQSNVADTEALTAQWLAAAEAGDTEKAAKIHAQLAAQEKETQFKGKPVVKKRKKVTEVTTKEVVTPEQEAETWNSLPVPIQYEQLSAQAKADWAVAVKEGKTNLAAANKVYEENAESIQKEAGAGETKTFGNRKVKLLPNAVIRTLTTEQFGILNNLEYNEIQVDSEKDEKLNLAFISLPDLAKFPAIVNALRQLKDLGRSLQSVDKIAIFKNEGKLEGSDGIQSSYIDENGVVRIVLGLNESSFLSRSDEDITHTFLHELGHAVDLPGYAGGVYSAQPEFDKGGAIRRELVSLWTNEASFDFLSYPINDYMAGKMSDKVLRGELFAQAWAAFLNPNFKAELKDKAPQTYAFMEDVANDVKTTAFSTGTPEAVTSEIKRKAELFANYRGQGLKGTKGDVTLKLTPAEEKYVNSDNFQEDVTQFAQDEGFQNELLLNDEYFGIEKGKLVIPGSMVPAMRKFFDWLYYSPTGYLGTLPPRFRSGKTFFNIGKNETITSSQAKTVADKLYSDYFDKQSSQEFLTALDLKRKWVPLLESTEKQIAELKNDLIPNAVSSEQKAKRKRVLDAFEKELIGHQKNVIAAINRTGGKTFFSKGGAAPKVSQIREAAEQQFKKMPKPIQGPLQHILDNVADFAKKGILWAAFTEDLAALAAKFIPSARTYVDLMQAKTAIKTKFERRIDQVLQQYGKLPSAVKGTGEKSVNRFLKDSTMKALWGFQPSWLPTVAIDPDMAARFKEMPKEAQDVIRSVFKHGFDTLQEMKAAVTNNINTEYDALIAAAQKANEQKEVAKLTAQKRRALADYQRMMQNNSTNPYAPLKRFGNYVIVGRSQAYMDAETEAEKTGDTSRLREMEKNENHYFVQFAETMGEAKAIKRAEEGNFASVEAFEKDTARDALYGGKDIQGLFYRLRNSVEESLDQKTASKTIRGINKMLSDLHLTLLSEASARQSERKRRNIAGAEDDMMRSFATQGRATAHFISSLENAGDIYETLQKMRKEAGRDEAARRYYNEFTKRHAMGLSYEPSPWTDKAMGVTSSWMLLTNPAYYLQNMTQPFMMSLPVIGAKHGYSKAWSAFTTAYRDISEVVRKHGISEESYSKLPQDVRAVVEELVNRGRINISLSQDIGRWRDAGDSKLEVFSTAVEKLRGIAEDIETLNRVATAVAAYRLEAQTNKAGALNYADKIIYTTHGDYSGFNAPRVARTKLGRLATQFRKFQLIQISLMARLFNDAFAGADADTRRVGKRALAFTLSHTLVAGGVMGMPAFTAIAAAYGMLFGDDDEPDNPELTMRRAIGNDLLADLLLKGAPAAAGVDLSGKLGMANMLSVLPYTDLSMSKKGVEAAGYALLTGPSGSLVSKAIDGIGLMGQGQYYQGVEKLLPTGLANVAKGYRYATEGMATRSGDITMSADEISFLDGFMVALGLPTAKITDRQFVQNAAFEFDKFYKEKTVELKRDYANAYKTGNADGLVAAREEWARIQEARVRNGYTRQPMSELLRAPQEQAKRERSAVGGVMTNKANRGFVRGVSEL